MIDIKSLTKEDKKRYVFYLDKNKKPKEEQLGFITSWNDMFVFVDYGQNEGRSTATRPDDLRFLTEDEEEAMDEEN